MKLINYIKKLIQKIRRRWILAKAYPAMKKAFEEQKRERIKLKKDIMLWLREYFGIDAKSKYIPKDYKNKEEVKTAVTSKFGDKLERLNLKYSDIFQ